MDSVNVLRYDRWRKINDRLVGQSQGNTGIGNRFDLTKMNSYTTAALKPMLTKDGFLKQSVIGGARKTVKDSSKRESHDSQLSIAVTSMLCTMAPDGKVICVKHQLKPHESTHDGQVLVFCAE